MFDFCAEHNIVSDIELIDIGKINDAYERLLKSDIRYRFVIDLASLKGNHIRNGLSNLVIAEREE